MADLPPGVGDKVRCVHRDKTYTVTVKEWPLDHRFSGESTVNQGMFYGQVAPLDLDLR